MESEAAVKAFKGNMEKLAEEQGKRRATIDKTNPSEMIKAAHETIITVDKFEGTLQSLEDYQVIQAEAASAAFKAKVQEEGKKKVDLIVDASWSAKRELGGQENNAFNLVKDAGRYPRSTGDKTERM